MPIPIETAQYDKSVNHRKWFKSGKANPCVSTI